MTTPIAQPQAYTMNLGFMKSTKVWGSSDYLAKLDRADVGVKNKIANTLKSLRSPSAHLSKNFSKAIASLSYDDLQTISHLVKNDKKIDPRVKQGAQSELWYEIAESSQENQQANKLLDEHGETGDRAELEQIHSTLEALESSAAKSQEGQKSQSRGVKRQLGGAIKSPTAESLGLLKLTNSNNYCFANSSLQMMNQMISADWLSHPSESKSEQRNPSLLEGKERSDVIDAFKSVNNSGKMYHAQRGSRVSTYKTAMSQLVALIPEQVQGEQDDAHQFLTRLLDCMEFEGVDFSVADTLTRNSLDANGTISPQEETQSSHVNKILDLKNVTNGGSLSSLLKSAFAYESIEPSTGPASPISIASTAEVDKSVTDKADSNGVQELTIDLASLDDDSVTESKQKLPGASTAAQQDTAIETIEIDLTNIDGTDISDASGQIVDLMSDDSTEPSITELSSTELSETPSVVVGRQPTITTKASDAPGHFLIGLHRNQNNTGSLESTPGLKIEPTFTLPFKGADEGVQPVNYELAGATCYSGDSQSGHYVYLTNQDDAWYVVDDMKSSQPRPIPEQEALQTIAERGYILMGKKVD